MVEMLEPAPLFGDGDDYGGPVLKSDVEDNDSDDTNNMMNNDNAGSDLDDDSDDTYIDHKKLNNDASTPKPSPSVDIDIVTTNGHHHHLDMKQEEEPFSISDNSNQGLINHTKPVTHQSSMQSEEPRATSAGMTYGEVEALSRVETDSLVAKNDGVNENEVVSGSPRRRGGDGNAKYRTGARNCCSDCYLRLYSWPRLRIFLSFLYSLISLILVCADIFGALWIGNEIMTFRFPNANTDFHELWFGVLMVLIIAPFLILWAAHLIFIEETISRQNEDKKCYKWCIKYPFMFLYVITPIGIGFLLIYEFCYIYLWKMIEMFFYRFLCRKPSYKMIMNIKKTKGSRAYLRFRKITHMFSSSIPLMIYYGCLYYVDPYPRLKWKYLSAAAFVSGLNSLFTILTFLNDAKRINIPLTQYFILSLRLFGGFIPKLNMIKVGRIRRINYASFAFGNYTYAKFADVIESDTSKLETVILTTSTLSDLSNSLCHQLGAVCSAKNVNIIILKNYTPFIVWKHLFPKRFPYKVTMVELKQAVRHCGIFERKPDREFDQLEADLDELYGKDNNDKFYYYRDFVHDWNGFEEENDYNSMGDKYHRKVTLGMFHRLLRILPPDIIDKSNKHTMANGYIGENATRDERLLNLVLGTGKINEIDPLNKTSALFYAIIQKDYALVNTLCNNGAKTSKNEWQKLGEYIIQLVKDNNYDDLIALIKIVKKRDEIECDLTYHDLDGKTAIMYSAINGNQQICDLLLNCGLGADILHVDQDGNTAADLARVHKHKGVEDYLRNQFL